MKKNFRFCILFILIFLFNTLIAKAEREVKKEDIELKNRIIYFKGEENSYNGIVKENYPNGKLKENLIVVNGKVNGNVKVYYENGNLKYNTSYKNNKKDGIEKIYSP
ncbi:toxin-antitoxin system YwqK family antitoxin, partial [Fusobacterium polymorphum]